MSARDVNASQLVASAPGDRRPLGVFDSGVGGLSVLHEIRQLLPAEDLIYVADTGYCPYGSKPYELIQARSLVITRFLVAQEIKALVVACNTASGAALNLLRATFDLPIVGIEPGVKPAAAATRSGVVGVLATGATLAAERFNSLAQRFAEGVELLTQACPGLAEQVEAGDLEGERTVALLQNYLEPLLARGADTIVLGCTHYPFLRQTIARLVGPHVTIIDTGPAVARQTLRVLEERGLRAPGAGPGRLRFLTSADPAAVAPYIVRLWGSPQAVERLPV